MNLLILGPQGSGKGTQAELLEKRFDLKHMDMGQLLREAVNSEDIKGADEIKKCLEKGLLVPDEIVLEVAEHYIKKTDHSLGIMYDGFPRRIRQYDELKQIFKKYQREIDGVIYLNIPEEETVKRLSARRTCPSCGKVYNLITNPPLNEGVCDNCRAKLAHRDDDKPEIIKERLAEYKRNTLPVVDKAKKDGYLIEVNGEQSIADIHNEIIRKLGYV